MKHFHPLMQIAEYLDSFSEKSGIHKGKWKMTTHLYGNEKRTTIRFNNETIEGYRFYLLFIVNLDGSLSFNKIVIDQKTYKNFRSRVNLGMKIVESLHLNR